jgi:hypothetical protein
MLRSINKFRFNKITAIYKGIFPSKYGRTYFSSKSFEKFPTNVGLYDKSLEKDSCGVGLVAHLKKVASRNIVLDANEMLVRMSHRGGCGCEENTGDGAGKFLPIFPFH